MEKIITTNLIKLGFWQIKIDNDSILITTFSNPRGHYERKVMHFGLKNAPRVLQRKMDKILSDYSSIIIVYIDDMLICSDNEKDHEKHLNIFITLYKEPPDLTRPGGLTGSGDADQFYHIYIFEYCRNKEGPLFFQLTLSLNMTCIPFQYYHSQNIIRVHLH